jgi:hypothetical protein
VSSREAADAVQARAVETVNQLVDALRALGWDFAAVSVARCTVLDDGSTTMPGASAFDAERAVMPALPHLADNLRALARQLDTHYARSGCPVRADGYTHVVDSIDVRRARGGGA